MSQMDLLDWQPPAIIARDTALAQVEANSDEWMRLAIITVEQLRRSYGTFPITFLAENLRHEITIQVGRPHSPKVWGALTMKLIRAGIINKTGKWRPMADKKSHARMTAEYSWYPCSDPSQ